MYVGGIYEREYGLLYGCIYGHVYVLTCECLNGKAWIKAKLPSRRRGEPWCIYMRMDVYRFAVVWSCINFEMDFILILHRFHVHAVCEHLWFPHLF